MKIETTISLAPELLQALERILGANGYSSLSELIEDVLRHFLASERREIYDPHELELINRNADRLNQEAEDVLTYQMELGSEANFIEFTKARLKTPKNHVSSSWGAGNYGSTRVFPLGFARRFIPSMMAFRLRLRLVLTKALNIPAAFIATSWSVFRKAS